MSVKVAIVSLGCDKNLVDSEVMLSLLEKGGYEITAEEEADIIIVNTCCFIQDAKEESIETILELAGHKENGNLKGIIAAGCLAQRYKTEIFDEMPEVDAIVGTFRLKDIVSAVEGILGGTKVDYTETRQSDPAALQDEDVFENYDRNIFSAQPYAYIKIAEGCDSHCSYCIIPSLRGKYKSRRMEHIIEEAASLAGKGIKELILVAQDTALYGNDLYGRLMLPDLLKSLCKIDGIRWIRVLYCYPENITDELIDTIKTEEKICSYIDLPVQHAHDGILKSMNRKSTNAKLKSVIKKLRDNIPGVAIRTTLIVGFPGEGEEEFSQLESFVREMEFDRLGVFTYSREEGTKAFHMPDQVEEATKEERKKIIMQIQKDISHRKCKSFIGKTIDVITEGKIPDKNLYTARSYRDAPDIDGLVFIKSGGSLLSGDFVKVRVSAAKEYDLVGVEIHEPCK